MEEIEKLIKEGKIEEDCPFIHGIICTGIMHDEEAIEEITRPEDTEENWKGNHMYE